MGDIMNDRMNDIPKPTKTKDEIVRINIGVLIEELSKSIVRNHIAEVSCTQDDIVSGGKKMHYLFNPQWVSPKKEQEFSPVERCCVNYICVKVYRIVRIFNMDDIGLALSISLFFRYIKKIENRDRQIRLTYIFVLISQIVSKVVEDHSYTDRDVCRIFSITNFSQFVRDEIDVLASVGYEVCDKCNEINTYDVVYMIIKHALRLCKKKYKFTVKLQYPYPFPQTRPRSRSHPYSIFPTEECRVSLGGIVTN